jgi:hypothetical protein
METAPFVNKVAESGIVTINLEDFLPKQSFATFDIKDYLFMGLLLKEKDFREAMQQLDTAPFANKIVHVVCSADAIVPLWAYMLVVKQLHAVAQDIQFGTQQQIVSNYLREAISKIDSSIYIDSRIVIKGCGQEQLPEDAYIAIMQKLLPVAKSIMYGEPCSTVPIYKKKIEKV